MPKQLEINLTHNRLLAGLPDMVLARLRPEMDMVRMSPGKVIFESGVEVKDVLFPVSGCIVSMLDVSHDRSAEIAVIGSEGMVGIALLMVGDTTPSRAIVQCAGYAYQFKGSTLKREFDRHTELQVLLLRYTRALITQMAQTAMCNREHSVEQQLCRWLLLSLDRLPGNEIAITQEFVASMLGRPQEIVAGAMRNLQTLELIRSSRSRIAAIDRPRLEKQVCDCYAVVKAEYDRLLSEPSTGGIDST